MVLNDGAPAAARRDRCLNLCSMLAREASGTDQNAVGPPHRASLWI